MPHQPRFARRPVAPRLAACAPRAPATIEPSHRPALRRCCWPTRTIRTRRSAGLPHSALPSCPPRRVLLFVCAARAASLRHRGTPHARVASRGSPRAGGPRAVVLQLRHCRALQQRLDRAAQRRVWLAWHARDPTHAAAVDDGLAPVSAGSSGGRAARRAFAHAALRRQR
eukprot:2189136-Prymnesium_polylepis.1